MSVPHEMLEREGRRALVVGGDPVDAGPGGTREGDQGDAAGTAEQLLLGEVGAEHDDRAAPVGDEAGQGRALVAVGRGPGEDHRTPGALDLGVEILDQLLVEGLAGLEEHADVLGAAPSQQSRPLVDHVADGLGGLAHLRTGLVGGPGGIAEHDRDQRGRDPGPLRHVPHRRAASRRDRPLRGRDAAAVGRRVGRERCHGSKRRPSCERDGPALLWLVRSSRTS